MDREIIFHRRSIRLKEYDYSQSGSYFVTVCTQDHEEIFGKIIDGEMLLNDVGKIVERCWKEIPNHFKDVGLDQFICMPNHVHGIIVIWSNDNENQKNVGAIHELPLHEKMVTRRKMLLPRIIGYFKMNSSKQINVVNGTIGQPVWQRNYYEHVIRSEEELNKIRRYIINNPPKWEYDQENRFGKPIDEKRKFWSKFLNEFEESG